MPLFKLGDLCGFAFGQDTAARRNGLWHFMTCTLMFSICVLQLKKKKKIMFLQNSMQIIWTFVKTCIGRMLAPKWKLEVMFNAMSCLTSFRMTLRKAMFDSADTHHYDAINFEEYLQLMNNMKIGSPVPTPAGIDEDRDEILTLCSDVSETHPFKQMCYGLF